MSLRQLALPFAHVAHRDAADFMEAPSNAQALTWIGRTAAWPGGRLALHGEGSVGKTHLLHIWTARMSGRLLDGPMLTFEPPAQPVAIDDADAAPPRALLHVINAAAEAGQPLLLAGRAAPAHWHVALPDLASRLRAMLAVMVGPPEESLLRALLMRLLAERQLAVPEAAQEWMLTRLPRTPAALREAAARFDRASLRADSLRSGGRNPRAIAAQVVAAMREPAGEPAPVLRACEDSTTAAAAASQDGPCLL